MKKLLFIFSSTFIILIIFYFYFHAGVIPFWYYFLSPNSSGKDAAYNTADKLGNYSECPLLFSAEKKQFCLWLASGKNPDIKICQLMDKNLYPPRDIYSQHSCFTNFAYQTNNKTACDKIPERLECLAGFKEMETNRAICGPKDINDKRWLDCQTEIYSRHSLSACDFLASKGQVEVDACKAYVRSGNYAGGYDSERNK